MALFTSDDIGIDLGTSTVLVYVKGKGIVNREPSVVAINAYDNEPRAFGEEARKMIGRTPDNIKAIRPIKHGVISNISITEKMLKHFVDQATGRFPGRKPRIVVCVPSLVSEIERRAVEDAAYNIGARHVEVIEEPLAAALGADLDIDKPEGNMVVDIGGGTTDIAVISLGGCVCSGSVRIAGDDFDQAILDYLKITKSLLIGERTAEEIKIKLGRAIPLEKDEENTSMEVKGRSTQDGYPKQIKIDEEEIYDVLKPLIDEIVRTIKKVFESTPPELAADIFDKGIFLTGGGSLLYGLDKAIAREIGVKCFTVDDPMSAVIFGIQKKIMMMDRERNDLDEN